MKRIVDFFKNIPEEIHISKREFLLTVAVCTLGGIVLGMISSPRKTQTFGSNNGNYGWIPDDEDLDDDYFEDED